MFSDQKFEITLNCFWWKSLIHALLYLMILLKYLDRLCFAKILIFYYYRGNIVPTRLRTPKAIYYYIIRPFYVLNSSKNSAGPKMKIRVTSIVKFKKHCFDLKNKLRLCTIWIWLFFVRLMPFSECCYITQWVEWVLAHQLLMFLNDDCYPNLRCFGTSVVRSIHHGMARPQVADGGDGLQIWRVAANILNKQSRTTFKGWFSSLEVGRGANSS
jgi:hypothetical protein